MKHYLIEKSWNTIHAGVTINKKMQRKQERGIKSKKKQDCKDLMCLTTNENHLDLNEDQIAFFDLLITYYLT